MKKMPMMQRKALIGWIFCIPFLIGFFLFFLVPVVQTAILSFKDVTGSILKKWTENSRYSIIMMDTKTKEEKSMESKKNYHAAYDEDFKKSIVTLYQNGRTQSQLSKEYGISMSAIGKWIKQYSSVRTEDGDVLTAKQIKELQKRNAQLEEENLILKKAIAIFTPHSDKD